jgi:hypothetical protein
VIRTLRKVAKTIVRIPERRIGVLDGERAYGSVLHDDQQHHILHRDLLMSLSVRALTRLRRVAADAIAGSGLQADP